MMPTRGLASLSLDLDNLWSYLRTHGSPDWERWPSYLDRLVPLVLEVLERHALRLTCFVVGRDAASDRDAGAIAAMARAGHEIGNHSFEHQPWLDGGRSVVEAELDRTDRAIEAATGSRPVGYRGPGYSWSRDLLEALADREYLYDASTLPALTGPLARLYYFRTARLDPAERARRARLFGTLRDGLRPNRPYHWRLAGGRRLLEIPVTTVPLLRVPFHVSYLLYVARLSDTAAERYFAAALAACRATGTEPSVLLHPTDFLGCEDAPELAFFPGMDLPRARKLALLDAVFARLKRYYRVLPMTEYASVVLARGGLPERRPTAAPAPATAGG
jgi:AcrR family transcriptional regulator